MGRLWAVVGAAVLAALALSGCAPTPLYQGRPQSPYPTRFPRAAPAPAPQAARPAPPSRHEALVSPATLLGWAQEDHAAALQAFQNGCPAAQESAMRIACARARSLGHADEAVARSFFEQNFRAVAMSGPGVLTAYFAPEYPARSVPDADFSAAVRPRPADLAVSPSSPGAPGRRLVRQIGDGGQTWSYPDRAGIELTPPVEALAYMRPEDLFFMQVQGSGILDFPDGRRMRAIYAGDNGRPFVAIASAMVRRGLLAPDQASATAIRAWLHAHPAEAQSVMDIDPRYVFFSVLPDDGSEPVGAAGLPLTAGRSVAVDPAWHAYGELCWIDATAPVLTGAARTYRRLVVALDTGSAIRGPARADLYLGRGEEAGLEAGRVRHTLQLIRLVPIGAVAAN